MSSIFKCNVCNDLARRAREEREAREALCLALPAACRVRFVDSVRSIEEATCSFRRLLHAAQHRPPVTNLADFSSLAGRGRVDSVGEGKAGGVVGGGGSGVWAWERGAPPAVGIDVEWRPVRKKGQKERVAVVQVSVTVRNVCNVCNGCHVRSGVYGTPAMCGMYVT